MPVFLDLPDGHLLSWCLELTTQNPNEAFNQIIWKKCLKKIIISRHELKIVVASAVINFSDGVMGLSWIFQSLDLSFGKYLMEGPVDKGTNRIIKMDEKTTWKKDKYQEEEKSSKKVVNRQGKWTAGWGNLHLRKFLNVWK